MWTTGNTVSIDGIIKIFQLRPGIERYVGFGKASVLPKDISGEKLFIKWN